MKTEEDIAREVSGLMTTIQHLVGLENRIVLVVCNPDGGFLLSQNDEYLPYAVKIIQSAIDKSDAGERPDAIFHTGPH